MARVTVKMLQKQLEDARRSRDYAEGRLREIGVLLWDLIGSHVEEELDKVRADIDEKADENHTHEVS